MIDYEADAGGAAPAPDSLKRLAALVRLLRVEEFRRAELDEALANAEGVVRRLSEETIPELLRECGLREMRLLDGSRVEVTEELDCGITEARRAAAHEWLRANHLDGIIKTSISVQFARGGAAAMWALAGRLRGEGLEVGVAESVHPQTLKAALKEERAAGRAVPEEVFGLRPYARTKITTPPGVATPPRPRKRK